MRNRYGNIVIFILISFLWGMSTGSCISESDNRHRMDNKLRTNSGANINSVVNNNQKTLASIIGRLDKLENRTIHARPASQKAGLEAGR